MTLRLTVVCGFTRHVADIVPGADILLSGGPSSYISDAEDRALLGEILVVVFEQRLECDDRNLVRKIVGHIPLKP